MESRGGLSANPNPQVEVWIVARACRKFNVSRGGGAPGARASPGRARPRSGSVRLRAPPGFPSARRALAHERVRRDAARLLPRGAAHGKIGGDDPDLLRAAVLGGQALDQRVGGRGEAHLERAVHGIVADAVEDDDAAGTPHGDEAGERVHQLPPVGELTGVEDVVAVEQVEHLPPMMPPRPPGARPRPPASPPRRAGRPRRRPRP